MTLNEKVNYKTVIECVKDVKYIYWVKKRLVWVFWNGREQDNEPGLKEGEGTEIETSASIHSNDNYNLL